MKNTKAKQTQAQLLYDAEKRSGDVNDLFMQFVREGMTREELQKNIDRRPEVWGRYSAFLVTLPFKK